MPPFHSLTPAFRRLRPSVTIIGVAAMLVAGSPVCLAEPSDTSKTVVKLIVDYGDGVQKHFTQLDWREGTTVFQVMQQAQEHPRGITFQFRGKGATVLVTQIDNVKNEGAGGRGQNWIYRIIDEVGDRSIGISPVEAGDTILWRFETYR